MKTKIDSDLFPNTQSRYDINAHDELILRRDYLRFNNEYVKKIPGSFISRIVENYMKYVEVRKESKEKFQKDLQQAMKEKAESDTENRRLTITNGIIKAINLFDFNNTAVNFNPRQFLNYTIHSYAQLPLWEREKVYCYDNYTRIYEAIHSEPKLNLVIVGETNTYEYIPYTLTTDDNSLAYYLVGYSRAKGENNQFEAKSIKLSRIKWCASNNTSSSLSSEDENTLKKLLDKFGPAHVGNRNDKEIIVSLTNNGYEKYYSKLINHNRPLPCSEPEFIMEFRYDRSEDYDQMLHYIANFKKKVPIIPPTDFRVDIQNDKKIVVVKLTNDGYKKYYSKFINHHRLLPCEGPKWDKNKKHWELKFDCSQDQIKHYFFNFGKEARIVSPKELREEFKKKYKAAFESYN